MVCRGPTLGFSLWSCQGGGAIVIMCRHVETCLHFHFQSGSVVSVTTSFKPPQQRRFHLLVASRGGSRTKTKKKKRDASFMLFHLLNIASELKPRSVTGSRRERFFENRLCGSWIPLQPGGGASAAVVTNRLVSRNSLTGQMKVQLRRQGLGWSCAGSRPVTWRRARRPPPGRRAVQRGPLFSFLRFS